MKLPIALSSAAIAVTLLASVPAVEAAANHVIGRNAVASVHIRSNAILPRHLHPQTRQWINAQAPTPRTRGVTVTAGAHGDRVRLLAANVTRGELLAQIEYLGGVNCEHLGPWPKVAVTFFDANGMIVATGSDTETSPVAGVRYPVRVFGAASAVRAEAVVSVDCV